MKWLLISLVTSLAASEKLDRTYLPPPGAQFAGGRPGDILAPLEPPNLRFPESVPVGYIGNNLNEFRAKEPQVNFPVTTTSYAFTQTTTFPSAESYKTNGVPINPLIGLPGQSIDQGENLQINKKVPSYFQKDDIYSNNVQPSFSIQKENQHIITPEGEISIPSSTFKPSILNSGFSQHSNNQVLNQHLGSHANFPPNIQITESVPQVSELNHDSGGHIDFVQQRPLAMTSGVNFLPQDQYNKISDSNYPTSINTVYPIQNQAHQEQGTVTLSETPQQTFSPEHQRISNPFLNQERNFQLPKQDYNNIVTTIPNFSSSMSVYSSGDNINLPQRPQAENDRNADILKYENVRTPNGYSYSYDTSNGIHVDESGIVNDGTKAQGSYSYTGDDGKIYSVYYTADENGFQPRGNHLPTAPPIPEAIKKVIEQALVDEASGIVDDGSYDENKYGYDNYHNPMNHHSLQENILQREKLKPISGITDDDYNENGDDDSEKTSINYYPLKENDLNKQYKSNIKILKGEYDGRNSTAPEDNTGIQVSYKTSDTINPIADGSILSDLEKYNDRNTFDQKYVKPNKGKYTIPKLNNKEESTINTTNTNNVVDISDTSMIQKPLEVSSFINDDNRRPNGKLRPLESILKNMPQVYENRHRYNVPANKVQQTKFPTIFREKVSLVTKPMHETSDKSQDRLTPESSTNSNTRQQYNRKSTTPELFMTSRVNSSRYGLHTDYDNDEDDDIQDIGGFKDSTHHQIKQSELETPSYIYSTSVSPISQSSWLDDTRTPQTEQVQSFTTEIPVSSNNFVSTKISNNLYQTVRPSLELDASTKPNYSSKVITNYKTTIPSNLKEYGQEGYVTSTNRPEYSTTTIQTTPGYYPDSENLRSSGLYQTTQLPPASTQYHYKPEFNVKSLNPERIDSQTAPGYYLNNHGQRPVDYLASTDKDSTIGRPEIPLLPGSEKPFSLFSSGRGSTTTSSIKPNTTPNTFGISEPQATPTLSSGYAYGPPKLVYPTSTLITSVDKSPDFTVPSSQPGHPSQEISTTQHTITYSPMLDIHNQNLNIDEYGRPISEQPRSDFSNLDQNSNLYPRKQFIGEIGPTRANGTSIGANDLLGNSENNLRLTYGVEQPQTNSKYNNQGKIIGENFSGPKQPQMYDPDTGYYYK